MCGERAQQQYLNDHLHAQFDYTNVFVMKTFSIGSVVSAALRSTRARARNWKTKLDYVLILTLWRN